MPGDSSKRLGSASASEKGKRKKNFYRSSRSALTIIVVGSLFPLPQREISDVCDEAGTRLRAIVKGERARWDDKSSRQKRGLSRGLIETYTYVRDVCLSFAPPLSGLECAFIFTTTRGSCVQVGRHTGRSVMCVPAAAMRAREIEHQEREIWRARRCTTTVR